METSGHTEYEPAEYEHVEYEPAESENAEEEDAEHVEYEPEESENAEEEDAEEEDGDEEDAEKEDADEEDAEEEDADEEDAEDEPSEDEHLGDESTEYEHTEFHINEFRGGAPLALIKNTVLGQRLRFVQVGAKTGEAFGVAGAALREKLAHAGSTLEYGAYSFTHPLHPVRRRAALDAHYQQKKLASERRKQRVGAVKSKAAARIAKAREGRVKVLEEGVY